MLAQYSRFPRALFSRRSWDFLRNALHHQGTTFLPQNKKRKMNTPSTSVPEASSLVFNPYSPPEATTEVVCNVSELQLASRWARLGAAVVDYLLVVSLVFGSQLIYYGNFTRAITESAELGFKLLIILALLETLFYWFINGIFLASDGQTLGKKLLRIRIVRGSGESANLQNLFFDVTFLSFFWIEYLSSGSLF